MKELENKLKEIKSIVDDLLDEIEKNKKPLLSNKQIHHLLEDINCYERASRHKYTHVEHYKSIFAGTYNCVRFYYVSERTGQERYDTLSGNPCYTEKMEPNKKYTLDELGIIGSKGV